MNQQEPTSLGTDRSTEPKRLSFGQRFRFAWSWLFRGLADGELAAQLRRAELDYDRRTGRLPALPAGERPSLPAPPEGKPESDTARQEAITAAAADARRAATFGLLGLLQREGRLVDFLQQDISTFSDADIGAAARLVHAGCRRALAEHVPVQPVVEQSEGAPFRVQVGYDPSAFKLTGRVAGQAPYDGVLRHRGWRAVEVRLPEPVGGVDDAVLAPAEVEIP